MNWKSEWKPLAAILGAFGIIYFLPVGTTRFDNALMEGLSLARWYAREHVILCLVPAFFIAGAISVFVRQEAVMKYLGSGASPWLSYPVASVSGTILAVCSCTVLPLFGGIYRRGAGLGPATAFLYSGPAINVLAIILTARVLGMEMGVARALGAVTFSVVIGMVMHLMFRDPHDGAVPASATSASGGPPGGRPLWQTASYFAVLVGILVFANWGAPSGTSGFFGAIYSAKWILTGILSAMLAFLLVRWLQMAWGRVLAASLPVLPLAVAFPGHPVVPFSAGVIGLSAITSTDRGEAREWFSASWDFTKQILPLLLAGVLVSGALLGRPGHEGLIPSEWVASSVGGNSIFANLFASVVGAFMYFATLTEVPILQGLIGSGMGKGPALALLLAGPALSLPSMLVIRSILGTRKTVVYLLLVVAMATVSGMIYGAWF
ncbi:MAG: permease [Candidatus Deferrimicrobiaceae bacterium]